MRVSKLFAGVILICLAAMLSAQNNVPNIFKYQGVAKIDGEIVTGNIGIQVSIIHGTPDGTVLFTERHFPNTNDEGVFAIAVGAGLLVTGSFSNIIWPNGPFFLKVEIDPMGGANYSNAGTAPLVSVPYALYAEDVGNKDDADPNPTNELQNLLYDSISGDLTISDGNTVTIPTGGNDNQFLSLIGTNLTIQNGNSVDLSGIIPPGGTDDQKLSLLGTNLSIEDGNSIDLSVIQDGVIDGDASSQNEIQILSFNPDNDQLSISGGNSVDLGSLDGGTNLVGGPGILISGETVTNTGDINPNDDITISTIAGGDISGTFSNLQIQNNVIGSQEIADGSISAGDLNQMGAAAGQVLKWSGMDWIPANDNGEIYTPGNGINIIGNTIHNTGDLSNDNETIEIVDFDESTMTLTIVEAGETKSVNLISLLNDADADPLNETIEFMEFDETDYTLIITEAGETKSVNLYSLLNDTDADPLNETIEILDFDESTMTLTIVEAGETKSINLISLLNDADADPKNELIDNATLNNTILIINEGGETTAVDLSSLKGPWIENTNTQTVEYTGKAKTGEYCTTQGGVVITDDGIKRYDPITGQHVSNICKVTYGNKAYGVFEVKNDEQTTTIMQSCTHQAGILDVIGSNGNFNTLIGHVQNYPNHGLMGVVDANNVLKAYFFIDQNGNGTIAANVKNFKMNHPSQPGKEIWYGSLEGPELAAYLRGTANLKNGKATVSFPEHYRIVANAATMTVVLTPLSGESKGLAVVKKSADGFEVVELLSGLGNYAFDWEVKCVRNGYENYRVIRDASEARPAHVDRDLIPDPSEFPKTVPSVRDDRHY